MAESVARPPLTVMWCNLWRSGRVDEGEALLASTELEGRGRNQVARRNARPTTASSITF